MLLNPTPLMLAIIVTLVLRRLCMTAAKRTSTVKHFASKRDVKAAPTVDFSIEFVRDGVAENHEFSASPRTTYGDILGLIKNQDDESGLALRYLDRMIRRALIDTDGTPAKFRPNVEDGHFTDPTGNRTAATELPKVVTFEAGSSRRRWIQLMEKDDDVEVEIEQIAEVFEYLAQEASTRPTTRS